MLHQDNPEAEAQAQETLDADAAALGVQMLPPDDEETAPEAEPEDVFYLLPCNLEAWNLWQRIQCQWMHGMEGPVGMHWPGAVILLQGRRTALARRVRRHLPVLAAMERAALEEFAKARQRNRTRSAAAAR